MDLDFLTEEVKKLARQTGEFLKKERFAGRTGILLGGGPLGRNEQLYSRLHAVLRKHCLAQPRGNTVGRSVRMRP